MNEIFGENNDQSFEICDNIGLVLVDSDKYNEALYYFIKSLKIAEDLNMESTSVATSYLNIAVVYKRSGDLDKEIEFYKKSLNLKTKFFGEDNNDVAVIYGLIGDLYSKQKMYKDALQCYEKFLYIRKTIGNDLDMAVICDKIETAYRDLLCYTKALKFYGKALEYYLKLNSDHRFEIATIYKEIAIMFDVQGLYDKALENYMLSYETLTEIKDGNEIMLSNICIEIAGLYKDKKDF